MTENTTQPSNQAPEIKIDIRSRAKTFFSGNAHTLTAINQTGEFDILPLHANFITLIKGAVILDKGLPTEKKFDLKSAVLSVIGGRVDVYVEV